MGFYDEAMLKNAIINSVLMGEFEILELFLESDIPPIVIGWVENKRECPIPCVNLIFFKFCLNNFIKN